jgi:hypothetical protein
MADDDQPVDDPAQAAAAVALDAEIDAVLAGRASARMEPTVLWLATAVRPPAPPSLGASVRRSLRAALERIWRPAQIAAAALASLLVAHGLGNFVNGAWVAENLGEAHSPHAYIESGFALLAVAVVVAAGLFRSDWLPLSVIAGVPLGVVLGIQGLREVGEFAWGAVLHLTEAALALLLLVLWWRARRYVSGRTAEGGA